MFGRQTVFRATETLCTRFRVIPPGSVTNYRIISRLPQQRLIHSTPIQRGLLRYLVGDHHHARLHKEIGTLLEDYDNALARYYTDATEAVFPFAATS
jgi:hypothetical protein